MELSNHKDKVRALAGTVIFHAVLLMVILFFGLKPPRPMPHERGVLVALGYTEEGRGDRQPLSAPPPVTAPAPATPETEPDRVVTQDTEESVALPDAVDEPHTAEEELETEIPDPVTEPEEVAEQEEEQEPEPQPDPRAMFPGQDQRSTDRQEHGETDEEGDEGSREGVIDANAFEQEGGGEGVEYSLTGRDANLLPRPEYTTLAQGRVVVRIVVDRDGNVIRATAGARGTNTTNATLHRLAEDAAKRARFNRSPNAPEEQIGTITYIFIRRN